jgi:multiple sugar transport system substrate-binding protein
MLRVALIDGPSYESLYRSFARFEQKYGISVEIGFRGTHPELNEHLQEMYSSGHGGGYDLISTHTKYAPAQTHYLASLDEWFCEDELREFSPSLLELARIEGELKSIPRNVDVRLLFYRTDWFCELGLPVPKTWDELKEACFLLKKAGRTGFVFPGKESGLFGTFFELLVSAGGKLFDERLQPAFDSEAGIWALKYLKELYQEGMTPAELPDMHYDEVSAYFRKGGCAMVTDWPGYFSLYTGDSSQVRGRFGIALTPAGPSGRRAVYGGCHSFAIPTGCSNMEDSVRLLKYMTSEEIQEIDAENGHVPVRPALLERQRGKAAMQSLEAARWDALEETLNEHVIIPPKFPEYSEAEDRLWMTLRRCIIGELPVERAVAEAAEEIAPLVEKYRV